MQLAIVAAGFTPGEADQLRRAMAAWKRRGGLEPFEEKLINGMSNRGYSPEFAKQIFNQIKGFGEYGFPESHSASFALLVYVSAWLKYHEPAAFTAALLNSQPMGFYASSQLIRCASRHGVEVRPADVNHSHWDCTLEPAGNDGLPSLRLGLRLIKGLSNAGGMRLIQARLSRAFTDVQDLSERAGLNQKDMSCLAVADALKHVAGNRHQARWKVAGIERPLALFPRLRIAEGLPLLERPREGQNIVADYNSLGFSLRRHPMALLRRRFNKRNILTADQLRESRHEALVETVGLVITRQRPGSSKGVIFITLEDETGYINLIVWDSVAVRYRRVLLGARLLGVKGKVQREGDVLHIIASRLEDHSVQLGELMTRSRNFR